MALAKEEVGDEVGRARVAVRGSGPAAGGALGKASARGSEGASVVERARVFKALGHPARLAVVERLGLGECCVCELMELCGVSGLSGASVSQHLLVLKAAGVVADERRGKRVFYRLLMPCVAGISLCVKGREEAAVAG